MEITKELARKIHRFHLANPNDLAGIEEFTEWLEAILHEPCSVWENEDGSLQLLEIRQLVERLNGLKIEIYSDEHAPPHFHVKSPNINASFSIESCELIAGEISSQEYKKVKYWHNHSKNVLIQKWNSTRPENCVVGPYKGT
ncbi:DUF4160 domain-containing protein [Cellvibrio sp. NN19]|uniref:DUF4160 domain-containing protein n=1 Tax=Cellvibrio chitinivorans TaxID=3102792 RepID=UPI002B40242F|nr:DUF4160 domain-containing protein [Cellvibrio sp. NN19]